MSEIKKQKAKNGLIKFYLAVLKLTLSSILSVYYFMHLINMHKKFDIAI